MGKLCSGESENWYDSEDHDLPDEAAIPVQFARRGTQEHAHDTVAIDLNEDEEGSTDYAEQDDPAEQSYGVALRKGITRQREHHREQTDAGENHQVDHLWKYLAQEINQARSDE